MKPHAHFARYFAATIALFFFLGYATPLRATNLTGTFRHPDGSAVNGKLIFLLSQPARLSDASAQIVPRVKIFSIAGGALEAGAFIYGNDILLPSGTHYQVRLVDANNNLLFEQKWYIQGTDMDLSTLTPTTIGVALPDPLLRNEPGEQAVEGPVTFNSDLTAYSLTLNGNLHPGASEVYDLGTPTAAWRDLYLRNLHSRGPSPWFDVAAYGAVCDNATDATPAYQAALNAAAAAGGGTVYFPPCASKYYLQTAVDLPANNSRLFWIRTLFGGNVRVGAEILIDQPDYIFEGGYQGSQINFSFQYQPSIQITHDAGVANVFRLLTNNTTRSAPAVFRHIGIILTGTTNGIYANATEFNNAAVAVVLDGVAIQTSGTGYNLKLDSIYSWTIKGNSTFDAGANASYSVYITNTQSSTSLLTVRDITINGAGIYWDDTPGGVISVDGKSTFSNVLTEGLRTPFLTINRAGVTLLDDVTLSHIEMADCVGSQPLVNYTGTPSKVRTLRVDGGGFCGVPIFSGNPIPGVVAFASGDPGFDGPDDLGLVSGYVFFGRDGKVTFGGSVGSDGAALFTQAVGINLGTPVLGGPVPKASLDISDGTGYGGTPSAQTRMLIQNSADHAELGFGVPNNKFGGLAVFDSASSSPRGRFVYANNATPDNGEWDLYVNNQRTWQFLKTISQTPYQIVSTLATGTAPFSIASTTQVNNLNSQLWGSKSAIDFSTSLDFGSIAAQTCSESSITAAGVATNNPIAPSWPATLEAGLTGIMYISAADTVKVRLCNVTGSPIDPVSQVFAGRVTK